MADNEADRPIEPFTSQAYDSGASSQSETCGF
jgi:hypothetical protein